MKKSKKQKRIEYCKGCKDFRLTWVCPYYSQYYFEKCKFKKNDNVR